MEQVAVQVVQAERGHAVARGLAGVHPGGDIDAQIGRQEGHCVASMLDRVELEFRVPGTDFPQVRIRDPGEIVWVDGPAAAACLVFAAILKTASPAFADVRFDALALYQRIIGATRLSEFPRTSGIASQIIPCA